MHNTYICVILLLFNYRAILKDTPILIFDEATSSLDSITEREIMRALEQATSGRTSVIIAHRLSTITHCDQILVLSRGQVDFVVQIFWCMSMSKFNLIQKLMFVEVNSSSKHLLHGP